MILVQVNNIGKKNYITHMRQNTAYVYHGHCSIIFSSILHNSVYNCYSSWLNHRYVLGFHNGKDSIDTVEGEIEEH